MDFLIGEAFYLGCSLFGPDSGDLSVTAYALHGLTYLDYPCRT